MMLVLIDVFLLNLVIELIKKIENNDELNYQNSIFIILSEYWRKRNKIYIKINYRRKWF